METPIRPVPGYPQGPVKLSLESAAKPIGAAVLRSGVCLISVDVISEDEPLQTFSAAPTPIDIVRTIIGAPVASNSHFFDNVREHHFRRLAGSAFGVYSSEASGWEEHPLPSDMRSPPSGNDNGQQVNGGLEPSLAHDKDGSFWPTVVVHLATLQSGKHMSIKEMATVLKEEFESYGHIVRDVEIRPACGVAEIEYDSIEGVRAAVETWANGPREGGLLAKLPLDVSEGTVSDGWRSGPRKPRRDDQTSSDNSPKAAQATDNDIEQGPVEEEPELDATRSNQGDAASDDSPNASQAARNELELELEEEERELDVAYSHPGGAASDNSPNAAQAASIDLEVELEEEERELDAAYSNQGSSEAGLVPEERETNTEPNAAPCAEYDSEVLQVMAELISIHNNMGEGSQSKDELLDNVLFSLKALTFVNSNIRTAPGDAVHPATVSSSPVNKAAAKKTKKSVSFADDAANQKIVACVDEAKKKGEAVAVSVTRGG